MQRYHLPSQSKRTLAHHHINDLLEVLGELLSVPELRCFDPDEMFDETLEPPQPADREEAGHVVAESVAGGQQLLGSGSRD